MSNSDFSIWQDPHRTPHERALDLASKMTTAEKLSQLGSCWPGNSVVSGDVAPMHSVFSAGARPLGEQSREGLGHLTRPFGTKPIEPAAGVEQLIEYQRTVMANNRFGLPAIVHEECLTGFTAWGATVYPAAIAWGATWNPGLVQEMAAAIGSDMRSVGVHQGLSPLLDVVRDYRWGRVEETIGEDPLLVATIGSSYVKGLQSAGVIATLKHFAGYPAGRAGRNHAPVSMGSREFREVMLFPFEMAVREGGVRSVMNSYSDVDGVPPGADHELLTGILRDEWGFEGTVVSDYWAIAFLHTMHRVAGSWAEAGALAMSAGLDIELPDTLGFGHDLARAFDDGTFNAEILETAVVRVLRQKAELGLLDPTWQPEAVREGSRSQSNPAFDLNADANRTIAARIAEQSVILLDNRLGALPRRIEAGQTVVVIGPVGDDPLALMGCYSFPNHVLPHHSGFGLGVEAPSVAEALRRELPSANVRVVAGVPLRNLDRSGIEDAVAEASTADHIVLVVGDRAGLFGQGTSGEGTDTASLRLPGLQHDLVNAVLAARADAVVVALTGRPYALTDFDVLPAATVQAFMPGQAGAMAVAGVLSGRINPSGHLPVQIPRLAGSQPSTYLGSPLGQWTAGVSNLDPRPAYPFGHGLSYTTFELSSLRVAESVIGDDGAFDLSLRVRNTGTRDGATVVQFYLDDHVAQTVRPTQRLVAFHRIELMAGQSAILHARIPADCTSFIGRNLRRIVEPGTFTIAVGLSAQDLPARVEVEIRGVVREVGPNWVMSPTLRFDLE